MERTVFQHAEREKTALPANIENAPELLLGLQLYMTGFTVLTSCRGANYGSEGPIPWDAMRTYCVEYGINGEQRQYFYEMLSEMDRAYLDYKAKKLQNSAPPP